MRRRPFAFSAVSCALAMVFAGAATASPALVVATTAEDEALRAAMRDVGLDALSQAESTAALQAAAGSGVVCADVDMACWQAVATLSGHDDVILATPTEIITTNRVGVRRSPRLQPGPDGLRGALLRLLGRAGAVSITLTPSTGVVTVSGSPVVGGVADGLTPGPATVVASAEGFASRSEDVVVTAGAVTALTWQLEAAAPVSGGDMSTTLRYGGLATIGVGAIAGAAIAGINFSANCEFVPVTAEAPNGMTCTQTSAGAGTPNHATTQAVDIAALAIGGGLVVVGVGAAVASFFVE